MQSKEEKAAYQKAWYERNKEKVSARGKAYHQANKEKIAARDKTYREAHKEERAATNKAYYEAHKEERHAVRDKAYREANKEKIAAYGKAWREANKEEISVKAKAFYQENKEEKAATNKAYSQTEAGKKSSRQSKRKRRAKKVSVNEHFTKEDERDVLSKFNHQCFNCGMTAEDHKAKWNESIHIDHLYPLSEGNALTQNNAIILCRSCNSSKGVKNPSEFFTIKQLHELRKKGLF